MDDLTPFDFDQTDKGWRLLDEQGKFLEAANAIESYIASHSNEIQNQNRVSIQTMYFHAGQEYAMAGEKYYSLALEYFQKAYKGKLGWDTYVDGTIGFIKKDTKALQTAADQLANIAKAELSHKSNSELLESFLSAVNTGKSYSKIYDSNRH